MTDPDLLLDSLAALVAYPDGSFRAALARCIASARATAPEPAALLARFEDQIAGLSLTYLQEAYTEAFDFDAACALDLGWHLHGERRERGELLVLLRAKLRDAGVAESSELPDHLTHVLMLLARQPAEERAILASDCAIPLDRIRGALRRRESPYTTLIDAVHAAVSTCGRLPIG